MRRRAHLASMKATHSQTLSPLGLCKSSPLGLLLLALLLPPFCVLEVLIGGEVAVIGIFRACHAPEITFWILCQHEHILLGLRATEITRTLCWCRHLPMRRLFPGAHLVDNVIVERLLHPRSGVRVGMDLPLRRRRRRRLDEDLLSRPAGRR